MFVIPEDSMFLPIYQTFFQQPVFSLTVFNIILSATYGAGRLSQAVKKVLGLRVLYVVAQLSYSMYLFNLLVVQVVFRGLLHANPELTFRGLVAAGLPLCLALAVVISVLSYLLVERPFMTLRQLIRPSRASHAQLPAPEVGSSTTY
jgi:peptidoglycan/LPS O-acetylase OafA/YrhL